MKQEDQNRLSMWSAVSYFLTAHEAVWSHSTAFAAAREALEDALAAAHNHVPGESGAAIQSAVERDALEEMAVARVVSIARSATAFALATNDPILLGAVDFSKSALLHTPVQVLPSRLKSMLHAARERVTQLAPYGVTPADIEAAVQAVDDFLDVLTDSPISISGKAGLNNNMPAIIKAGRMALLRLDNLAHIFEGDAPGFRARYKAIRSLAQREDLQREAA